METLRQSKNNTTIIGTLKSKDYKYGTTKAGDAFIAVTLVVVSKVVDKITEHKVELWTKESSKLAKGYKTIIDTYKTIDADGEEAADRVKVVGSYEPNEYMKDGELKVFKKIKGLFVNRLDGSTEEDISGVAIEGVLIGSRPEIKAGLPTGRLLVTFYSVGYNNTINEYNDLIIEEAMAESFKKSIPELSTIIAHVRLDKFVVIEEQAPTQQLFGSVLSGVDNVVKTYVNEDIMVGAMPVNVTQKYTNEQIMEMKKHRELQLAEKRATVPAASETFNAGAGFGGAMSDSDLPF